MSTEHEMSAAELYNGDRSSACSCTCCTIKSRKQHRKHRYKVTRSPASKITHLLPLQFIDRRSSPYAAKPKDDVETCLHTSDTSYSFRVDVPPPLFRRKRNSL